MDEYMFLVVAKLEAERRKLEREQRVQLQIPLPSPPRATTRGVAVRGRDGFFSNYERREQS